MISQDLNQVSSDDDDESSIFSSLLKLEDASKEVNFIDMDFVNNFCNELKNVTTTKRLSLIEEIETKFLSSFNFVFELEKSSRYHANLLKVLNNLKSNIEYDYFKANILENIDESN